MKLFNKLSNSVKYGFILGIILNISGLNIKMWQFYFAIISLVLIHNYLPFKN